MGASMSIDVVMQERVAIDNIVVVVVVVVIVALLVFG